MTLGYVCGATALGAEQNVPVQLSDVRCTGCMHTIDVLSAGVGVYSAQVVV